MTAVTLQPEVKTAWLEALRSGRYTQGTGCLTSIDADGERRDCCLGVLCDVAVRAGLAVDVGETVSPMWGDRLLRYDGQEGLLPASVWKWATTGEIVPATNADPTPHDFDVQIPNLDYDPDDNSDTPTFSSTLSFQNDGGDDYDTIAGYIEAQL